MSRGAESLATDGHHQKGILSDEPNKPLEACQAASSTANTVIRANIVGWAARDGLIFGEVM
jgi:hypothetical protein